MNFFLKPKNFLISSFILLILSFLSIPLFGICCDSGKNICPLAATTCYGETANKIVVGIFIIYAIIFLFNYARKPSGTKQTLMILGVIVLFLAINFAGWEVVLENIFASIGLINKTVDTPQKNLVSKTCVISGCSGQICGDEPAITPCDYRPEYSCYKTHSKCEIQQNGECGWTPNKELLACLKNS